MTEKFTRRKLFVDPEVQGALVTRCVIYWCLSLFVVFVALLSPDFIFATLGLVNPSGPGIWIRYAPGLILAAALTPLSARGWSDLPRFFGLSVLQLLAQRSGEWKGLLRLYMSRPSHAR